jgi:AcrR family transcriptional regulator
MEEKTPKKTRSDGERSRKAILEASARLATVEGLRGLSIGGLASSIGMSKSGLYAHFGSKEELQLATIETASDIFDAEVVRPAAAATGPKEQLEALVYGFIDYVSRDVFPGGCFFAAAEPELDTHPGRVRDRIAEFQSGWLTTLAEHASKAQAAGELDADEDPDQLAFELNALLLQANALYVMFKDRAAFDRARRGIERRLALAAPSS